MKLIEAVEIFKKCHVTRYPNDNCKGCPLYYDINGDADMGTTICGILQDVESALEKIEVA
jgi:hypothetical protein